MHVLVRLLRDRLVPATLTAAGVALIAAEILDVVGPATAGEPMSSAGPTRVAVGPSRPLPTLPPVDATVSTGPVPSPTRDPGRVATRIVIEALGIDLPVIRPLGDATTYPQCDVAMYIQELAQPGQDKATYLYAHARDGMFGPIHERAILKRSGGPSSMIGMIVQVFTSDDWLHEYEIVEVRLHQLDLDDAVRATDEELWLQTSEGPRGTAGKTQVIARPFLVLPAEHSPAHPTARPTTCD